MQSTQPERELPEQVARRVTPFQRCIVVKVLRPDRLESAMQHFVNEAFGGQQVQPAPFALRNLYENESNCREPILFIITPGSDPSSELQEFAENVVGRQCFHELAMGGGQNDAAVELVKNASHKGEWVCLKNLHLVTSWLPSLEKELKMLNPDKKFRLWLTSEPHAKFPSILLQSSLKITYETPPGVRNNLMRTFQYVAPSQQAAKQNPLVTQLLFVLSWFHALIQERRKYIPQGWSKYYEFSFGDLKAGELTLTDISAESRGGSPQWQKVYGILENAIYGGRVDNSFDLKVLQAYIA
jgi:dynein heavy chain 2